MDVVGLKEKVAMSKKSLNSQVHVPRLVEAGAPKLDDP
jgi:hypothetical protein